MKLFCLSIVAVFGGFVFLEADSWFLTPIQWPASPDFNCPVPFGYYPNPLDCNTYFSCFFGIANLKFCLFGGEFDTVRSRCVPAGRAQCANSTQSFTESTGGY